MPPLVVMVWLYAVPPVAAGSAVAVDEFAAGDSVSTGGWTLVV